MNAVPQPRFKNIMNQRTANFVGLSLTLVFAFLAYLWSIDELKFLGRKTDLVTAVVVDIKLQTVKGGYIQLVTYEFSFNGARFTGQYKGTYLTGKQKLGDLVKVKVARHKPTISKRLATLRRS